MPTGEGARPAVAAIVFDFDGVILDSEEPEFLAWQEIWAEAGLELSVDEWGACIGGGCAATTFDPYAELVKRAAGPLAEDQLRARKRARANQLLLARPALAGVRAWLEEATEAGFGLAVASSSPRRWVEPHLERLGLSHYFGALSCSDDCGAQKPDPASYVLACRLLGVAPAEALAVEDSLNGLRAARAAGARCLVVPNAMTAHMDFSEADMVLTSLEEAGPVEVAGRLST